MNPERTIENIQAVMAERDLLQEVEGLEKTSGKLSDELKAALDRAGRLQEELNKANKEGVRLLRLREWLKTTGRYVSPEARLEMQHILEDNAP